MREKEAEALAVILAERYELPYIDLSRVIVDNSAIRLISEEVSRKAKVVVFAIDKHQVSVAVQTPNTTEVANVLDSDGGLLNVKRLGHYPHASLNVSRSGAASA